MVFLAFPKKQGKEGQGRRQKHVLSQSTTPFACTLLLCDTLALSHCHSCRGCCGHACTAHSSLAAVRAFPSEPACTGALILGAPAAGSIAAPAPAAGTAAAAASAAAGLWPFEEGKSLRPPPVLPSLAFLEKGKENHPKKQGFFIPSEPLKSLEKKGKPLKKTRNSPQGKKQGIPKKQGKEGKRLPPQHLHFTKDPRPLYYKIPSCVFYHKNVRSKAVLGP